MGISWEAVRMRTMVINIENLTYTMLIGADVFPTWKQEIATSPLWRLLAMTWGWGGAWIVTAPVLEGFGRVKPPTGDTIK